MRFLFLALLLLLLPQLSHAAVPVTMVAESSGKGGRIDFLMREKVRFKAELQGESLIVTFEQPIEGATLPLLTGLREWVESASLSADRTKLILGLKQAVQLRTDASGTKGSIFLQPKAAAKAEPKPAEGIKKEAPLEQKKPDAIPPKAAPKTEAVTPPVKAPEKTTSKTVEKPAPKKEEEKKPKTPAANAGAVEVGTLAPLQTGTETTTIESITPRHESNGIAESLIFPWAQKVPAAAMVRGKYGWVVFGVASKVNMGRLLRTNSQYIEDINATVGKAHVLVTFRFKKNVPVEMFSDKDGWTLRFSPRDVKPKALALETRTTKENTAEIFVPDVGFSDPIEILDEKTGQRLLAVPLVTHDTGMPVERRMVDFVLPVTAQGLFVEPLNDALQAHTSPQGVRLWTPTGMQLSPDVPAVPPQPVIEPAAPAPPKEPPSPEKAPLEQGTKTDPAKPAEAAPPPPKAPPKEFPMPKGGQGSSLFPYEQWKVPEGFTFPQAQVALNHLVGREMDHNPGPARLRLAQLYLAEGMFPEALNALRNLREQQPAFAQTQKTAFLEGVALFMRGDYKDALEAFNQPELAKIPEVEFWKHVISIADGTRGTPFRASAEQLELLKSYSPAVDRDVSFLLAEKAIIDNNYDDALRLLGQMAQIGHLTGHEEKANLYKGFIAARLHQAQQATKLWTPLLQSNDRMIRARAGLAMVDLKLSQNGITTPEAIKKIESLMLIWRGGRLEMDMMYRLGQLYIANKQYREGFEIWRELIAAYPESDTAKATANAMSQTFINLFNKGAVDAMPPLDALSLYYDFRELTPLGHEGDIMIQKLADRLVQVDLLPRAAALLSHQVKHRLEGDERSMVAARLAYIHLRNKEPDQAYEVLRGTDKENLPPLVEAARRHLLAEALIGQKKYAQAFALVASDPSPPGRKIAVQALWELQDWPKAVQFLTAALSEDPPKAGALTESQAEQLIRLAMAYQFNDQGKLLGDLRKNYMPVVKGSKHEEAFTFLTEPVNQINHTNIERLGAILGQFDSFMKGFDKKVKDQGLSQAIEGSQADQKSASP